MGCHFWLLIAVVVYLLEWKFRAAEDRLFDIRVTAILARLAARGKS